jgi:hypothetical protein
MMTTTHFWRALKRGENRKVGKRGESEHGDKHMTQRGPLALLLTAIVLSFVSTEAGAQGNPVWEIQLTDKDYFYGGVPSPELINPNRDRSQLVGRLKTKIRSGLLGNYFAERLMAYYFGDTEHEWLLDTTRAMMESVQSGPVKWFAYYRYQFFRGFFGDEGAVQAMDSIVRFADDNSVRFDGIEVLAGIGKYDYWNVLDSLLDQRKIQSRILDLVTVYGTKGGHAAQAKAKLEAAMQDTSQDVPTRALSAIRLGTIDHSRACAVFMDWFRTAQEATRKSLWRWALDLDVDLPPQMGLEYLAMSQDPALRRLFIPDFAPDGSVDPFYVSSLYYQPEYVRCVRNWSPYENDLSNTDRIAEFLRDFRPTKPDSGVTSAVIVDTMRAQLFRLSAYGWVGDNDYVNTLDGLLQSARMALTGNDRPIAIGKLREIWSSVDGEYADSLDGDNGILSREGWRFLHYNTLYALERVGQVHKVPGGYGSIQSAVNSSAEGDVIEVGGGKFDEIVRLVGKRFLTIRKGGTTSLVTVRGIDISGSQGVCLSGIAIDASGTGRPALLVHDDLGKNSDLAIEGCEMKNAGKEFGGMVIEGVTPRLRVVNCIIHDNGLDGVTIRPQTTGRLYFLNNTIVRNGENGIAILGADSCFVVNNILSFNGSRSLSGGRYGLLGDAGTAKSVKLYSNLIVNNHGQEDSSNSVDVGNIPAVLDSLDSGNLTSSGNEGLGVSASSMTSFRQIFRGDNPLDLRLHDGSVAVDRGTSTFVPPDILAGVLPDVDVLGTPRRLGSSIDIGAFER